MRVLVTGAFGNIGSACLGELLRQGHTVRAFDIRSPRTEETARDFRGHLEILWGDIRDYDAVEDAVRDQEVVIHLAAIIPPATGRASKMVTG